MSPAPTDVPSEVLEEEDDIHSAPTVADLGFAPNILAPQDNLNQFIENSKETLKELHKQLEALERNDPRIQELVNQTVKASQQLSAAALMKSCPPSWRQHISVLTPQDPGFQLGVSRKAETKPKRVMIPLGAALDVLTKMLGTEQLTVIVNSEKLEFESEWLAKECWFMNLGIESRSLSFARFEVPQQPVLISFELNEDYHRKAEQIKVNIPSGGDRRKAWRESIEWITDMLTKGKLALPNPDSMPPLPDDYPFKPPFSHFTERPCVLWIGIGRLKEKKEQKEQRKRVREQSASGTHWQRSGEHQWHGYHAGWQGHSWGFSSYY